MTSTIEEFRARVDAAPPKDLDQALLMLQADLPVLVKDKAGQVGQQKTRYADLVQANAVIIPRLNALGLVWKTKPTLRVEDPKFVLSYVLKHLASGEYEEGFYPLKLADNPQHLGSAITYARRYALLCVTGIVSDDEDDDGQAAAGQRYAQRAAQRPRQQASAEPPAGEAGEKPATAQRAAQRPRKSAQPPLPGEEDPNGPVGQDQHKHMHALWREIGYGGDENREQRLTIMTRILELPEPLESSSNLKRWQGDKVIDALKDKKRELLAKKAEQAHGGEPS